MRWLQHMLIVIIIIISCEAKLVVDQASEMNTVLVSRGPSCFAVLPGLGGKKIQIQNQHPVLLNILGQSRD